MQKYCTDDIAKQVWLHLFNDFQPFFTGGLQPHTLDAFIQGIPQFRDVKFTEYGIVDPYKFKASLQLESYLKKYRFNKDKYSDQDLEALTNSSYLTHQEYLASHLFTDPLCTPLLRRMRRIITSILGKSPDMEEVWSLCRFGRKSNIGCPLRKAYLDLKVSQQAAFTSSTSGYEAFNMYLKGDSILERVVSSQISLDPALASFNINELKMVNVEKSWKTKRSITPLTALDLFLSYGIGRVIQDRLVPVGIDIQRQQEKHRRWVKRFSETLTHATADLSRASDSITITLLMRVLPRKWLAIIKPLLRSQIKVGDSLCYTESVLPMGNGFTFPLETLLFYALLRSASELTKTKGLISVYGDDLIYPRRLHRFIPRCLTALGFNLNLEKTYVRYPFRESCGSDYYRGVDVRPAQLQGGCQLLSSSAFCSFLYKVYNGLARRWERCELPSTFSFLESRIRAVGGTVFYVPPSYPDTAGIKSESPMGDHLKTGFCRGTRFFQFPYLAEITTSLRRVRCTEIYYWEKLRGGREAFTDEENYHESLHPSRMERQIVDIPLSPLLWRRAKPRKYDKFFSSKMKAFTWDKSKLAIVNQITSVSDWA